MKYTVVLSCLAVVVTAAPYGGQYNQAAGAGGAAYVPNPFLELAAQGMMQVRWIS